MCEASCHLSFWSTQHEVDTSLVVKVYVSASMAWFSSANARVKMQPFPTSSAARNKGEDVNVDVVETGSRNNLSGLSELLSIGPCLPRKVVICGGISYLALDHGGVVVQVVFDEAHDLLAILVVTVLLAVEVNAQTSVVTASISLNIPHIIANELEKKKKVFIQAVRKIKQLTGKSALITKPKMF